ncbi:hypothetical protein [Streptomyces sp. NPDC047014]|uniref:hypothetical protein n=1 Tax=Streptomyces sp. NPDC047014 TaxID=3155736 RepID=UPI0033F2385C
MNGEQRRGRSPGAEAEGPWKDFEHVLRAMDRLAERSAARTGTAGRNRRTTETDGERPV